MGKFRCKNCNYSFELQIEHLPKICPNCGRERSMDHEKSAADILNESE